MSNLEELNHLLWKHNRVDSMRIESEEGIVKYNLQIRLAESELPDAQKISITFFDVCELRVVDFGGGLMQFMDLKVTRIDNGLDRIRYELNDEEDEKISCKFYRYALPLTNEYMDGQDKA